MSASDRSLIALIAVLAAAAAGWFLVIGPKRDEASKLNSQLSSVQSQLSGVQSQIAAGQAARSQFSQSYMLLAKLGEAIPPDDNVPSLVWQLQSAAHKSNVDFQGLTLNASSSSGSSTTTSTTTPTSSASAAQVNTASLPPGATVGAAGLPIEPFTFTFNGNFFHLSDFFGRIQRFVVATDKRVSVSGRLLTLNAISLGAGPGGFPRITATISATTYIVPVAQGEFNGATQAGPATSSTQTATASAGSSSSPAAAAVATSPLPR
jgi:type II secretory pathway pseudopilin PulG